jgi:hypothetical protein
MSSQLPRQDGQETAIWTSFMRPDVPDLIVTAPLLHLNCSATRAINSALALPSTGGDFNFATHVPSADCVSEETRERAVTLTRMILAAMAGDHDIFSGRVRKR